MNLHEQVIEYLEQKEKLFTFPMEKIRYGRRGITVREANEVLGTTELRKIMSDFRARGYKVFSVWEEGENRYGNNVRFKRYFAYRTQEQEQSLFKRLAGCVY